MIYTLGEDKFNINTKPLNDLGYITSNIDVSYISFTKISKDQKSQKDIVSNIFIRKDKRWYYDAEYEKTHSRYTRGLDIKETEAILNVIKSMTKIDDNKSINKLLGILGEV